jgi:prevent-host-death family protein
MKELGVEEARRKLGDVVNRALIAGERTVITRNGTPAAVVVPVEWYLMVKQELGDEA